MGYTEIANSTKYLEKSFRTPKHYGGGRGSHHQSYQQQERLSGEVSRHARCQKNGSPCQSYVLLSASPNANVGCLIKGQIPGEIIEDIPDLRSTSDNVFQTRAEPVAILNSLGNHGYTVVGMGKIIQQYTR